MTFRTNQPGSALASLSAFWERSTQNRAMDICAGETTLPSSFNRHTRRRWLRWPRLLPLSGGGSPHLHSHSMEEQLLNPHYNQPKFSPDRYMMLNRDRDRERGLPLCWLFETKALIGMVLIPMFLLASFGFESLPLPVPYSSFESRHPGFFSVCRGKCLTFLH